MNEAKMMEIGPVQLIVVGFEDPDFHGRIDNELQKVREKGVIRMIDLQFVYKDNEGNFTAFEASDLSEEEKERFGAVIGGLIGFGAAGERGARMGAEIGAETVAEQNYGLTEETIDQLRESIPGNSAAALMLIEHRWAIGFRDALRSAGGVMLAQGMVTPELLIRVGEALAASVESAELEEAAMEEKKKVPMPAR
jgi:uncharacterized membrane protein